MANGSWIYKALQALGMKIDVEYCYKCGKEIFLKDDKKLRINESRKKNPSISIVCRSCVAQYGYKEA